MEPSHHKLKVAGRVAQLVALLTERLDVPGSIPGPDTSFVSPSADSNRVVFSYWGN